MTTTIGTNLNVYSGIRENSQITNTYGGYLTSSGNAYDLVLPFQADKLEWYNYTKFGTDTNNLFGIWFRDMPDNEALIINRGNTNLTSTLETTNGIEVSNTKGGFADQHLTITGVSTSSPSVVTTGSAHNLSDFDRVRLTKLAGNVGVELNNKSFVVKVLTATTIALYDIYGLPVDVTGTYTSGGQLTKINPQLGQVGSQDNYPVPKEAIQDYPVQYKLTLGTSVMGASGDLIYFVATKYNSYFDLGTI